MPKIYVKDYDVTLDVPDDADMNQVQEALKKQFPPKNQDMSWGEVGSQAVQNVPESAVNFLKSTWNAFSGLSPLGGDLKFKVPDTVKGIYRLGRGTIESLIPGDQGHEQYAEAVLNFFKDRYGGIENIKQSIAKDPVGVASDVALLFAGASKLAQMSNLAKTAKVLGRTSAIIDPINLVTQPLKVVNKGLSKIPILSPRRAYASAVKPGTKAKETLSRFGEKMDVGLEQGIMPNQKGAEKLQNIVSNIEAQKTAAIDALGGNQQVITANQALRNVPELQTQYTARSPFPQDALDEIGNLNAKFIQQQGSELGLKHAMEVKKGLQKGTIYGKGTSLQGDIISDWHKQVARGINDSAWEIISQQYPELRSLNKTEGTLLSLQDDINNAAKRIAKRDILGIGLPIKTGVGAKIGELTGLPGLGTLTGAVFGILDTPTIKAKLAILRNKARKQIIWNEAHNKLLSARLVGQAFEGENE